MQWNFFFTSSMKLSTVFVFPFIVIRLNRSAQWMDMYWIWVPPFSIWRKKKHFTWFSSMLCRALVSFSFIYCARLWMNFGYFMDYCVFISAVFVVSSEPAGVLSLILFVLYFAKRLRKSHRQCFCSGNKTRTFLFTRTVKSK